MLKKTTIAVLLSTAGLIGCSKMFQDEPSNSVKVVVTAKDTTDRLTEQEPIAFADVAIAMGETITIDASKTYPLVLSLHGAGGKGSDNLKSLKVWTEFLADENLRRKHPCFGA